MSLRNIPRNVGGTSCDVYKFDGYAIKIEKPEPDLLELKLYERELIALDMIQQFDWAPKVVGVLRNSRCIVMVDAGKRINPYNMPKDSKDQISKIFDDLDSINLRNDDVGMHEFLVNEDGKITLCDWGWCSLWVDGKRDPSLGGHEGICTKLKPLAQSIGKDRVLEIISDTSLYKTRVWR